MPVSLRPSFVGLTGGFVLAASLFTSLGPGVPAVAQSSRAGALAPPLEPYFSEGVLVNGDAVLAPVPIGKLLVVESVFARLAVPTGQHPSLLVGSDGTRVFIALIPQGAAAGGIDLYGPASPTLRLYLPTGALPVRGTTNGPGSADGNVTLVGHLVSAPIPPTP